MYTCIDTYVCVCKDTCKDFGTISHLRCTYTCKDVGTISHLRCTNTCAYFFQLFFNSDLPSIYLIRSGDGRISSSILPRWDLFFHRCKERGQLKKLSAKNGDKFEQQDVRWVGYAAVGCSTKAPDIGLDNICMCTYYAYRRF